MMSVLERGLNERVMKLRDESENTAPTLTIERALLVTEAYREHGESVSAPVLRALTFKHVMENKTICINDGELIVGERGLKPQSAPTYPELCCHTVEDFELISKRDKIAFQVSDEVKAAQEREIIPFWKGRSMRDKIFRRMNKDWHDCYSAGIFTEFMEQRAPGHTVAGGKIYKQGMLELKEEINAELLSLDFKNDQTAYDKGEQLKAMAICSDAIITFARRHAVRAREMAAVENSDR